MPPLALDVITLGVTFLVGLACYPVLIRLLRRARVGQVIQKELSAAHQRKAGTPTGGGILFIAFGVVGGLLSLRMHPGALPATVAMVLYGLLGLFDDAAKLRIGQIGIPARLKLPLQIVLAIPIAALAYGTHQHFIPDQLQWLYWPIAVLAITGTANGVNYSDGLDGLCGGLSAIAFLGVALVLPGAASGERAVAMVLVGGLLAFLVFNRHPARVFMGDTGALGLGAALAAMALQQGWAILLLLLGLVFVVEVLSVIIQVSFFKLSGGRRIFRMTPIHLTFQLEGWSEPRIVLTFWATGVACMLASGAVAWAAVQS
jgi:phospho-N-acetylmuramoyl-pentapeptide-transferase